MKKRLTKLLGALCALAFLFPPAAALAAGESAIQLGASGMKQGDMIYFGKFGTYDIPWVVLPPNTLSEAQTNAANKLPLLSKYVLDENQSFRSDQGYYSSTADGSPSDSLLKAKMAAYYNGTDKLFTSAEQSAVAETTLTGASMYLLQSDLSGQRLFPLSLAERNSLAWASSILQATRRTNPIQSDIWWLRSSVDATKAHVVLQTGNVSPTGASTGIGSAVRPAFYLDLSSVLFTSAAVGGKSSGAEGADALKQNLVPASTTEWKLTLLDSGRSGFSITTTTLTPTAAELTYIGAKTGTNEYLSAVIVDGGSVAYYGRIKSLPNSTDASGTVQINIPAGITLDVDTQLKVFNEQFNGDRAASAILDPSGAYTDYASALKTVTAPGTTYAVTVTNGTGGGDYAPGDTVTITAAPPAGTHFTEWTIRPAVTLTSGSLTTATATFTMPGQPVSATAAYEANDPTAYYPAAIINGSGGYTAGAPVTIIADAPPAGMHFKEWTISPAVTFTSGSLTTETATFTMPAGAVSATATYEANNPVPPAPPAPAAPIGSTVSITGGSVDRGNTYSGSWSAGCVSIQADCAKLASVIVDGTQLIKDKEYTVKCGSTLVTLTPAYLATLEDGAHSIRVQFTDGRYDGSFTTPLGVAVTAIPDVPATGGAPWWALSLIILGLLGAAYKAGARTRPARG